ncbi:MAG TPA: ferrous iron transporter B [Elusimicrobia bacterium]|nr:ferrous iron transporter B [Elusimicrobiota bacterium]HBT61234.1 ferrous iron transporter B [Elusimicrobiota bacterium]
MNSSSLAALSEMAAGSSGVVESITGADSFRRKLSAMGLHPGRIVRRLAGQGAHGPLIVEVLGSQVAMGHSLAAHVKVRVNNRTLLLVGNPNVGKSVVFSRLTGLDVVSSNYPGTTVSYLSGGARLAGARFNIVDVPGIYSLEPASKADEVACRIISADGYDLLAIVVDATNLERNLFFALQILGLERPSVILLNKSDMALLKGIRIDARALSDRLGVPVVPFVAVTGEGLPELERAVRLFMKDGLPPRKHLPKTDEERWKLIGQLSRQVQHIEHKHPSLWEYLADISVRPATGLPLALGVLAASFFCVRTLGEGMIRWLLDPVFHRAYLPLLARGADFLPAMPLAREILLGASPHPLDSFGLLTTGVYVPLVAVLPYILSFHFILGFLEDLGYLPRLAVLLDRALHHLGLHGYGTIPITLGLGCKVPAIMAARVLETRRERVIAVALTMLLAPCMPQSAMIFGILAPSGWTYVAAVFGIVFAVGIAAGVLLHRILAGETPELFVEIPPYQRPRLKTLLSKTWLAVRSFLREAAPLIALGMLTLSILDAAGIISAISKWCGPVFSFWLGLPDAAAPVMVFGFLRKDVSIAMLAPLGLSPGQLVVACVFLSLYLPCVASASVLARELGLRDAARVILFNLAAATITAAVLNITRILI